MSPLPALRFDVPLAQSVADTAYEQLTDAGHGVVGTGAELIMDDDGVERAIQVLKQRQFDLLILLQASFADSTMAVQIAQAAARAQGQSVPLLLWAVPDERSGGRLRLNSLCGINLAGHGLTRAGLVYDYIHTEPGSDDALAKISVLARVGRARKRLAQTRVGLVGEHPAGFDTCVYDHQALSDYFGIKVAPLSLADTLNAARVAPQEERTAFLERVGNHLPNLAELDQTALSGTAGVYASLRQTAADQQLDGIAVRCWPEFFTELGCAACGAMSMLCEDKIPASCEADVNGTVTLILMQALSNAEAFVTDLVSIDAESDTGVLWHCGLAPISMADQNGEINGTVHSNRQLPLLFEFALKPGRVTIARLNRWYNSPDPAQPYRLVIGGGEMVESPKAFGGTSGVVRFDAPATQVFDQVMTEGLEHHFCIAYGDTRDELRAFAKLTGLPILELT